MQKTNDPKVNAAIGLRKSLIAALKAEAARRGIPYAELCRQYLEAGLTGNTEQPTETKKEA